MTIKEQMTRKVAHRLFEKYVEQYRTSAPWAWTVLKDAARNADATKVKQLTDAALNTRIVKDHLRDLARAEAEKMLENNNLDLTELDRIFN